MFWRTHRQHKLRHSLGGKLLLLFLIMGIIFIAAVGGSISHLFRSHFDNNLQPLLHKYIEYIHRDIGQPADLEQAGRLAKELNLDIYIQQGDIYWSSTGQRIPMRGLQFRHHASDRGMDYGVVQYHHHEMFYSRNGMTTILFDIPNLHQERGWNMLLPLVILLLVLMLLYHFTRRLVAPITTIRQGISRFAEGNLKHRIPLHGNDELSQLAEHINNMASEIDQMLDAKRQLLLAISHELRSPITRAKVSLEMLDDGPQRQQLNDDLNEMETLIGELIETERLSTAHHILNKSLFDPSQLIRDVVAEYFADASPQLELPDRIDMDGDVVRIKILVKNLIDNALRHSPPQQAPTVSLTREAEHIVIQVCDEGEGIAEQHLPHLTEPFYRVDPARQRQTGGFGLGLYLCRLIAEAHAGSLQIQSQAGEGTCVTVRLSLA